jgi:hypothetical protein
MHDRIVPTVVFDKKNGDGQSKPFIFPAFSFWFVPLGVVSRLIWIKKH